MICRFETKPAAAATGAACCPGAVSPAAGGQVSPEAGGQGPPSAVAGVSSPLTPVFERLVGREVKVVAGCHIYCGRVLQSNPLTLIGPSGEVMIIAQAPSSVQY
jgi:hypothetical protein